MPAPLRLAYDDKTNTVAVASMDLNEALAAMAKGANVQPASSLLTSFDAKTRAKRVSRAVATARGPVNMEGLAARGGYLLSGGFNTQVRR